MSNTKPLHLMTRDELDYTLFKMTGIKPVPLDAPQKEHDAYQRLLEIRLNLLNQEIERRQRPGITH